MLVTRRALVLSSTASFVLAPKRVQAQTLPMPNELLAKFKQLDENDNALIKKDTIEQISNWEAIKYDKDVVASLPYVRYSFLLDLYTQSSTFFKPMDIHIKFLARRKMAVMYESAQTDDEKALVMQVIGYYELLT